MEDFKKKRKKIRRPKSKSKVTDITGEEGSETGSILTNRLLEYLKNITK